MIANIIIVLIGHAIFLNGQFLKVLEKDLLEKADSVKTSTNIEKISKREAPTPLSINNPPNY